MKSILFIADPISRLHPKSDSTFALVRAALRLKLPCYWAEAEQLSMNGTEIEVEAASIARCPKEASPELADKQSHPIHNFSSVWIRKDPPFDESYLRLAWLLSLVEDKVALINPPSRLLRFHEKLIPLEALSKGYLEETDVIPTWIGSLESAKKWVSDHQWETVITKPFLGYGGRSVERYSQAQFLALSKSAWQNGSLVQPFQKEVETLGDRRVFLWKGKILADVVRMPKPGGFVSNFAQGGTGVGRALTQEETTVLKKLGRFLEDNGILLAGADLIGNRLSEVNITSPTGLIAFQALTGKDYAETLLQTL